MKKIPYFENVINFFKKKITLSFLLLLNLAAYSNPISENLDRESGYNFLSGNSLFISLDHYLKNNAPGEASHAAPTAGCTYSLSRYSGYLNSAASDGNTFVVTVWRGSNCACSPVSNVSWITNITQSLRPNRNDSWEVTFSCAENTTSVERYGRISIGKNTYLVIQRAGGCRISLASTSIAVPFTAGEGSFSITSNSYQCRWSATVSANAAGWLSIPAGQTMVSSKVNYSYLRNTSATVREGTIVVGGQTYTVRQSGTGLCAFTLSLSIADVPALAGSGSVLVRSNVSACRWFATVDQEAATWISIEGQSSRSGIENTLIYSFRENPTTNSREGRINVSGQTHTIIQEGACVYTLAQDKTEIGAAASTVQTRGSFSVTVQSTGCSWTPVATDNWISHVTKAQRADGSWTVSYSYTANNSLFERVGGITVGNKTHTVTQAAGCSCALASTETHIGAAASTAETRGSFSVTIQGTNCRWTPSTTDNWITNVTKAQAANGSWTVTYSYTANTSSYERKGLVIVADKTYKVVQAASCSYILASRYVQIGAAASTAETRGSFSVTVQGTDCRWTPSTTKNWITNVTKAQAANGSWTVTYSYTANTSGYKRKGLIIVADKTYEVVQAKAANLPSLYSITADVPATAGEGSLEVVADGAKDRWAASVAQEAATWLTITEGQTLAGTKNLTYSYTANPASISRTGTITVGGQTFTVTQSAETEAKMGIEPISSAKIFPNPAKDFVTIDLSENKIKYGSLKIVNQVGQILYKVDNPPTQALQIPLNGFTSGLYFILLQGEGKIGVEKLIVQ